MIVGERYQVRPELNIDRVNIGGRPCLMTGLCVWVHPAGRFAVLEFQVLNGKLRECFRTEEMMGV